MKPVHQVPPSSYKGGCACGAIIFYFSSTPDFIANCFCSDCKKASGGVMATFVGVPQRSLAILHGKPRSYRYVAASGRSLERYFCGECGSRLFTGELEALPGTALVQYGSLDNPETIAPRLEMFTSQRPAWMCSLGVTQFEGMPDP